MLKLVAGLFVCLQVANCYYWIDYHIDVIPSSALVAGVDNKNNNVYVGQVYVTMVEGLKKKSAICPMRILRSEPCLVEFHGVQDVRSFAQMLCGEPSETYEWIPTNSTAISSIDPEKRLVTSGVESDKVLGIGRLLFHGSIVVGKVPTGSPKNAALYFVHDEEGHRSDIYAILTYTETKK